MGNVCFKCDYIVYFNGFGKVYVVDGGCYDMMFVVFAGINV